MDVPVACNTPATRLAAEVTPPELTVNLSVPSDNSTLKWSTLCKATPFTFSVISFAVSPMIFAPAFTTNPSLAVTVVPVTVVPVIAAAEAAPIIVPSIAPLFMSTFVEL